MKELSIEAKVENLNDVLGFITGELEAAGCSVKLQKQIKIAAEEIFVNIACYAYSPATGEAAVRVSVDDRITVEFEDKGVPYNPLEKTDPDTSLSTEEREPGGLGIFIVKKIMDTVEYRRDESRNILTIKKHLDKTSK